MKKNIKAHTALLCALLLSILTLAGCKSVSQDESSIVCSSFITYDWVSKITAGDEWDLHLLGARGADIHSYEPTVRDIAKIARCRVLVRIGGESEDWAGKVISAAKNDTMTDLALCEEIEYLLCEDGDGHGTEEHHHEGHEHRYDEHIWFSFEYSYACIERITDTLTALRPESETLYRENARQYLDTLREIEAQYVDMASSVENGHIVVCDRFPFYYLARDLGIEYSAAFEGCSAESEASFSVVSSLAKEIDQAGLGYVLICEGTDGSLARSVINATKSKNARILTLDSMQSLSEDDIGKRDYASQLLYNLEVLKTALGVE